MKTIIIICILTVSVLGTVTAQWVQCPIPNGLGVVRAFTSLSTAVFAATDGGGVVRSTDNGMTWMLVNNGITTQFIQSIVTNGTILFAGSLSGEIFRSTNSGESWVKSQMTNQSIIVLTARDTGLFAGTLGGGVFRSMDSGVTWTVVNSGLTKQIVYSLAVSGSILFAGTNGGVFRSSDNGETWTAANNGVTNQFILSLNVRGADVFAGTDGNGVFRTTNNGDTWLQTNLTASTIYELAQSGASLFAGTNSAGVYFTSNNGTSWTAVNTGLTSLDVRSLSVLGTTLFAGMLDGTVFKADLSSFISSVEVESSATAEQWCYPNPATERITLNIPSALKNGVGELRYTFYNQNGQEEYSLQTESEQTTIPSQHIPNGVHTVFARRGMQRSVTMVVVKQ